MEPDLEFQKHRCKICTKGFSTGRSLGGHMRSHTRPSCFDTWEKEKEKEKEKIEDGKTQASFREGYDLRENPKKTWRLSEEIVSSSKHCNECGKAFPSWKSFFEHMKLHSEMICSQGVGVDDIEEQETGSWSTQKVYREDEPLLLPIVPRTKKRSNRTSLAIAASSSTITDYESEQEDVAISLMMLSRDIGGNWVRDIDENWGNGDRGGAANESSDKNSVVEGHIGEEISVKSKSATFAKNTVSGRRYQCRTCEKSFQSYHALGGHRASHKRTGSSCQLKTKDDDINRTSVEHLVGINQKPRVHECFICGKTFSSGHALGGHRRSHLVSNGGKQHHEMVVKSELLDLNLPAKEDEGTSSFKN